MLCWKVIKSGDTLVGTCDDLDLRVEGDDAQSLVKAASEAIDTLVMNMMTGKHSDPQKAKVLVNNFMLKMQFQEQQQELLN